MRKLLSRTGTFLTGVAVTVLVVVLLMAFGVVPVKTQTTTIVKEPATTQAASNSTASLGSADLTPTQIYDKYSQGVVEVLSTFNQSSNLNPFGQASSSQALGSGFVVSSDGYILTNAHVVSDNGQQASSVAVVFKKATDSNSDTTQVKATVVGIDETSDVALLKVDPKQAPTIDPLPLGDSSKVQVGESVVAIGNPLGYDFSVTSGIVSATNRNLQSPNNAVIPNGIQTDAAINSGNSGGPLIDSAGQVIGINEQIASQSGGNQGLGFAVPINTAAKVMAELKTNGKVTYAYLGVQGQTLTADVAKALGIDAKQGVLVAEVASGSPAAKAGIKGGTSQTVLQGQVYVVGGDVIQAIDGKTIAGADELAAVITQHKPGDTVTLTVLRGSSTKEIKATLATRPAGA
jgi:S1-C subfamily serine protease